MAEKQKKNDLSKNPFLSGVSIMTYKPDQKLLNKHFPAMPQTRDQDARK